MSPYRVRWIRYSTGSGHGNKKTMALLKSQNLFVPEPKNLGQFLRTYLMTLEAQLTAEGVWEDLVVGT